MVFAGDPVMNPASVTAGIFVVNVRLGVCLYMSIDRTKLVSRLADQDWEGIVVSENIAYELLSSPVGHPPAVLIAIGKCNRLYGSPGFG